MICNITNSAPIEAIGTQRPESERPWLNQMTLKF